MKNTLLEKIFLLSSVGALASLLVVLPNTLMQHSAPRGLFLHGFLLVAVFAFLLLAWQDASYRKWKKNSIILGGGIFLLTLFLALPFSIDPTLTFLPTPNRMVNVLTFVLLVFWMAGFASIASRPIYRTFLLRAAVIVADIGMLVSFMSGKLWSDGRLETILGNPLHFAAFLVPMVFITLFAFASDTSVFWKRFHGFSAVVMGVFLILLAARGPLLGALMGLFLLGAYLIYEKDLLRYRFVNWGILLLAILVASGIVMARIPQTRAWGMEHIPFAARRVLFAEVDQRRLLLWETAMEGLKSRPVFGYGAEQFEHELYRAFDKNTGYAILSEPRYDRVHNGFIDHAFQFGLIGFFGLAMLWLGFFTGLFKRLSDGKDQEVAILFAGGIAYLVTFFFFFETPPTTFTAFFLLALGASVLEKPHEAKERVIAWRNVLPVGAILLACLVFIVYLPLRQSLLHHKAIGLTSRAPYAAKEVYEKAFAFGTPFTTEYLLWVVPSMNPHLERDPIRPEAEELLTYTADILYKQALAKPYHTRLRLRAVEAILWTANEENGGFEKAHELMDGIESAGPNQYLIAYIFGELAYKEGDHESAIYWYEKAAERAIGSIEQMTAIVRRGASFVAKGEVEQGLLHLALAEKRGFEIYSEPRFAKEFAPRMTPDIDIDWAVSYIDHVWRLHPSRLDVMRARTLIHYIARETTTGRTMVRTMHAVNEEYAEETVKLLEDLEQIEIEE